MSRIQQEERKQSLEARRLSITTIIGVAMICALLLGYVIALVTGSGNQWEVAVGATGTPTAPDAATPDQARPTAVLGVSEEITDGLAPGNTSEPATASASADAVPAPMTPVPTPTLVGQVFLSETFDAPNGTWLVRDTETSSAQYVDGTYQLALNGDNTIGVAASLPFANYRLSADVIVRSGSAGLIFIGAEPATFYRMLIRGDGTYAVQAFQQNINTINDLVPWTESSALQRGEEAINRMEIERHGDMVRCLINGQPVVEFRVPSEPFTNQYGLTLTADGGAGLARFDNFVIEQLEP